MSIQEVFARIKSDEIQLIDMKFCDIHGAWQHFTLPQSECTESIFSEGLGFDGSSIRGWRSIHASDMLIYPDSETAFIDPFAKNKTLNFICDIVDPDTSNPYDRSPRTIAKKAEAYLKKSGIADKAYFGPEAEFFIFDNIRYGESTNQSFYEVDSSEGIWNAGRQESPNLGYKIRHKEGYLPVPPSDQLADIRADMVLTMMRAGIHVERDHHEVATGGQAEIGIRYNTLMKIADDLCKYKYIIKNVAHRHNKTATFMPKPLFGDNGSGMHVHLSLWKGGKTLFSGDQYAGLSQEALWYIGGLLKHAHALCAICNPTNNSYKRLVPGYEAPSGLAYSKSNRSVICRIPFTGHSPNSKRLEFRSPDPSANPYLAFSALLMAGLDGIIHKVDPGDPIDKNLYEISNEDAKDLIYLPDSLKCALKALEKDYEFLTRGNVFTEDFIENYIKMKYKEYDAIRLRPHPHEYHLYYDC